MNAEVAGKPPAVCLWNPKFPHNVGNALRACSCWGIEQLWWTGRRVTLDVAEGERLPREERMKGYRNVEMVMEPEGRVFDRFPKDCVPVAIELLPNSHNLIDFQHPENAIYIFGPEDGSIPQMVRRFCHSFVFMQSAHCLNLAAAVNVILYDRRVKRIAAGLEEQLPLHEMLREHRGPVWGKDN